MTPLDLTTGPPSPPRAELEGIVFLPRTIDKIRATLPGGMLGVYQIRGFSVMMLDTLGITLNALTAAVAAASSDAGAWSRVRMLTTPSKIAEWNAFVLKHEPCGGNREKAAESYPCIKDRPDLILTLDVIEEDDKQIFAGIEGRS